MSQRWRALTQSDNSEWADGLAAMPLSVMQCLKGFDAVNGLWHHEKTGSRS